MHHRHSPVGIPEETKRVAEAAFPKGNVYMTMRQELKQLYPDEKLHTLFSHSGRPGEAPGALALILVMQYAEGLSDRQAAEAVRSRIDWKYALGLRLEDAGFSHGVLAKFRQRLLDGGGETVLLEEMLTRFNEVGLLKTNEGQRTDATHIVTTARTVNRLELVGTAMRQLLEVLAVAYPEWLTPYLQPSWAERYGARFESYRLPKAQNERVELAEAVGTDGAYLLEKIGLATTPEGVGQLPAVRGMGRIWRQQFYYDERGKLRWRTKETGLPPGAKAIQTPFDLEARYSRKRETEWIGYKVHLTESCTPDAPNLITHVLTTAATTRDSEVLETIQVELCSRGHAPQTHFVDAGYVDADNLVSSKEATIDLLGPVQPDTSWQGRETDGFDLATFAIDWEQRQVTCPAGKQSVTWSNSQNSFAKPVTHVRFSPRDCTPCPQRSRCTRSEKNPRSLKFYAQAPHLAVQQARARQKTDHFTQQYKRRAGAEGTISQAVRSFDLRRTRYKGLAKTHLHNLLVAAALNLTRVIAWLQKVPVAQSRSARFVALMHT